ncbi:MAG: class I SAM-dependent methyltransferase [Lentisphaerota bacterium]
MNNASLDLLLRERPLIHSDGAVCYGLHDEALQFIDQHVDSASATLETGTGLSTVLFALKGCRHVCVSPVEKEFEQIRSYCEAHGLSLKTVQLMAGRSEDVLPILKPETLDFLLIDGGHGFPIPYVDWLYAGRRLKPGGWLMLDDTQLWTVDLLRRFLLEDPDWAFIKELGFRTAVFQKVTDRNHTEEWCNQPFVVRRQTWLDWRHDIKKTMGRMKSGRWDELGKDAHSRLNKYWSLALRTVRRLKDGWRNPSQGMKG